MAYYGIYVFPRNTCGFDSSGYERCLAQEDLYIMELNELRNSIDDIDKDILSLFEKRMDVCRQVALYKKQHDMPVFQKKHVPVQKKYLKNVSEGF